MVTTMYNNLNGSVSYSGVQLLNNLPIELRQPTSSSEFKSKQSHPSFKYNFSTWPP